MVLVDTSVWIDFFNGKNNWQVEKLETLLGQDLILIGDLILTEILQGFRREKDFQTAENYLKIFKFVEIGGYKIALQSAKNYRILRQNGVTVRKTIDVMIGTFCIENEIQLLHNDKDFLPLEEHFHLLAFQN